jgi:adenylate cyclase
VVGVLQLLSKEGESAFIDADLARSDSLLGALSAQVAAITKGPDYLKILGLGDQAKGEDGTVVYFDLSSSSILFQELSSSFALQLLNEYFERMCEIAFQSGATIDNYLGDGALLRFNVPRHQVDHEFAAVRTALDMNRAFAEMREYWAAISPQLGSIYNRVGISTGPLLQANLGHSQVQSLTVLGYPISVAAALCDAAPRDRSVVFVSEETQAQVKDRVIANRVDLSSIPKAARFTTAAYEVSGIR